MRMTCPCSFNSVFSRFNGLLNWSRVSLIYVLQMLLGLVPFVIRGQPRQRLASIVWGAVAKPRPARRARLLRARDLYDLENQGRKGKHHPKGDARICKCHWIMPFFVARSNVVPVA